MMSRVRSGLDVLVSNEFEQLRGLRVGLLANQAAVAADFSHAADLMSGSAKCKLTKLFAPEHGFRGEHQDMDTVGHGTDALTGLPVISLYGRGTDSLRPKSTELEDLDILVVDLPDIGSRYYTFAQSLVYSMQECAKAGVKVLVLDRPNPINGVSVEGAELKTECRSFCGYAPIANRHGLTLGEIGMLANAGFGHGQDAVPPIGCSLEILKVEGWDRASYFEETGLPWIIPSVNMPTVDTAVVYPGACLFEATNISEGRGTTKPFEFAGAPFIDGRSWIEAVEALGIPLPGVFFRPISFMPKFQKWANQNCGGVQLHVTDRYSFQPVRCALALIYAAARLYSEEFAWRSEPYEFIGKVPAVDLLYGNADFRNCVSHGENLTMIFDSMKCFEATYTKDRKKILLY